MIKRCQNCKFFNIKGFGLIFEHRVCNPPHYKQSFRCVALNRNGGCPCYERKWWKFWVKEEE
jgi:hypothetical protein